MWQLEKGASEQVTKTAVFAKAADTKYIYDPQLKSIDTKQEVS